MFAECGKRVKHEICAEDYFVPVYGHDGGISFEHFGQSMGSPLAELLAGEALAVEREAV